MLCCCGRRDAVDVSESLSDFLLNDGKKETPSNYKSKFKSPPTYEDQNVKREQIRKEAEAELANMRKKRWTTIMKQQRVIKRLKNSTIEEEDISKIKKKQKDSSKQNKKQKSDEKDGRKKETKTNKEIKVDKKKSTALTLEEKDGKNKSSKTSSDVSKKQSKTEEAQEMEDTIEKQARKQTIEKQNKSRSSISVNPSDSRKDSTGK